MHALPLPAIRTAAVLALSALMLIAALPAAARDSLGIFGEWGAFRDPQVPRCYAIAAAEPDTRRSASAAREFEPFASIATWPEREVRGQLHVRLSRAVSGDGAITLQVGRERFTLTGKAGNAWAAGPAADAEILAAIRSAARMTVSARDQRGNAFTDSYSLEGAATAMDAASVGCSGRG